MHKYEVLRHCAEEFRLQLEKYAKEDLEHKSELEWFIRQWMPLYEQVMRKEVRIPDYDYQLDKYFVNPDLSKMAETYHYKKPGHPLNLAAGAFSCAMRDRYSDAKFAADLRKNNESVELIPDAPPPPEEEAPLPVMKERNRSADAGNGWLYRWIFGERRK